MLYLLSTSTAIKLYYCTQHMVERVQTFACYAFANQVKSCIYISIKTHFN